MELRDYQPTADLARAFTIPALWYIDPAMLELEKQKVFRRTWQAVGHARDVAQPGQYFACEAAGEPLAVVRGRDGVLHAFVSVCRHRAAVVVQGKGTAGAFRCPYHNWTYSLDGRLLAAPEFEGVEEWNAGDVCLPRVAVEEWGPFVFVNMDGQAPLLAEVLGDIPRQVSEMGCPAGELSFSERRDYVIDCNWKVYIDNYLEGYHLPAAHPSLFRELDYAQYRVDTFRWYSSQFSPIKPAREEDKRQYPAASGDSRALYFWIFPNFMLNVYPDNLSSNVILPLGPHKTLTIFEWFTYGDSRVRPETIAFSDEIQQEDIVICESVQRGLQSSTYTQGRLSVKREKGVHHFHLLLEEALNK